LEGTLVDKDRNLFRVPGGPSQWVDESGREFITGLLRGQVEEQKQKSQVEIQGMSKLVLAVMKDLENTT
jgi:hypothetical protein